jgi:hypothetical protein
MARGALAFIVLALVAIIAAGCSKTGAACHSGSDCGSGQSCVYAIADRCAATGTCQDNPAGADCSSITLYCGCDGNQVGVSCADPDGYARAPVGGLLQPQSAVCPRGSKDAGSPCSDTSECGVEHVCVFLIADGCAAKGVCEPQPAPAGCGHYGLYCGCDGRTVAADCGQPDGYAPAPVAMPKSGACAAADASAD